MLRLLQAIQQHDGVCIMNADGQPLTYWRLAELVEHNSLILEELGYRSSSNGQTFLLVDLSVGWKFIPLLLAALKLKVTLLPLDAVSISVHPNRPFASEKVITASCFGENGVLEKKSVPPAPFHYSSLHDVALLLFTSGTTGRPKAVMLTYNNIWANVQAISQIVNLSQDDRLLVVRPFNHASALSGELIPALLTGCALYVKEPGVLPLKVLNMIECYGLTVLCTTPTVASYLAALSKRHISTSLRLIVLSGESLTETQKTRIVEAFPSAQVWNAYGLTEASPRVSCLNEDLRGYPANCIGRPLPNVRVRIVDDQGNDVPEGTVGHLLATGSNMMKGYFEDEEATRNKLTNGWLHTGDLALLREGLLYYKGRADQMFTRGGVNIYPEEIEEIILKCPGIHEVLVTCITKEKQVPESCAYICAEEFVSAPYVYNWLIRNRIDRRLFPDRIEKRRELPTTLSGKRMRFDKRSQ